MEASPSVHPERGPAGVARSAAVPAWAVLAAMIVVGANALAGVTTRVTIRLMHGVSPFAAAARTLELSLLPYWRCLTYGGGLTVGLAYLWPIIFYFRCGTQPPAPPLVQRRVTNAPVFLAALGFGMWLVSVVVFPTVTIIHFGHWSRDLMSQQVLSPLVNGFLAATVSYLLVDWLFRAMVIPRVFPRGQVAHVTGSVAPGVRTRLLMFLIAVAFIPLFMLLGLVRAAVVRIHAGLPPDDIVGQLAQASTVTFAIFVVLGVILTLIVARSLTLPLGFMAAALKRVEAGDLHVAVTVDSADEVGVLADGVNAMVETLRDRERILQTFGRVVEPSVRDRLLAGDVAGRGEVRWASILFCDLRGFTRMAERAPPIEVVATLNEFFTLMTAWVRECGGFVDKFIGDALLVVFGLFDTDGDTAGRAGAAAAVRCALGMHERLAALDAARAARGLTPLSVSVGIHSGEVLAGTIGAADRHEYTVIGDTVNVAARLQQLSKEEDRALLVSEATYDLARAGGLTVVLTPHAAVVLRGRSEQVRVFGLA